MLYIHFLLLSQVYVEVDSLDWKKREWLKVQDPSHQAFLVEKSLVWGERIDPYVSKPNTVRWPALVSLIKNINVHITVYSA